MLNETVQWQNKIYEGKVMYEREGALQENNSSASGALYKLKFKEKYSKWYAKVYDKSCM